MSFKVLRQQFLQESHRKEVNSFSLKAELQATVFVLTKIQTAFMVLYLHLYKLFTVYVDKTGLMRPHTYTPILKTVLDG